MLACLSLATWVGRSYASFTPSKWEGDSPLFVSWITALSSPRLALQRLPWRNPLDVGEQQQDTDSAEAERSVLHVFEHLRIQEGPMLSCNRGCDRLSGRLVSHV